MILDYLPQGTKSWLINLASRKDRLDESRLACSAIGLEFERFPAIDGYKEDVYMKEYPNSISKLLADVAGWTKGAAALIHTTISILEDAKEKGYPAVLIMEDDIEFNHKVIMKRSLEMSFSYLPEDWESINFGCIQNKPHKECLGGCLHLITRAEFCHCYVLRDTVYDFMLEHLRKVDRPLDHITAWDLHSRGKSYAIHPNVAFQRVGYSNIRNKEMDYTYLR